MKTKTLSIYRNKSTTEFHFKGSRYVYGFFSMSEEEESVVASEIIKDNNYYGAYTRRESYFVEERTPVAHSIEYSI